MKKKIPTAMAVLFSRPNLPSDTGQSFPADDRIPCNATTETFNNNDHDIDTKNSLFHVGQVSGYFGKILQHDIFSGQNASMFLSDLPLIEGIRLDLQKAADGFTYYLMIVNTLFNPIKIQWQTSLGKGKPASGATVLLLNQFKNVSGAAAHSTILWHPNTAQVCKLDLIINNERWYKVECFCISDTYSLPTSNDYHNIRISIQRMQ